MIDFTIEFAKKLLSSKIVKPSCTYQPRSNYSNIIETIYSSDGYTVIIGQNGCGKRTLVSHTLSPHCGIIRVYIRDLEINIYTQIAMAMGIPYKRALFVRDSDTFIELIKKTHLLAKKIDPLHICNSLNGSKWRPCIVVEVDDFAPPHIVGEVTFALRCLTLDGKCCAVLVLEDSSALNVDLRTDNVIWVDNFTKEEALSFAGTTLIGTHPATLSHFMKSGRTVAEYTDTLRRRSLLSSFNFETETQSHCPIDTCPTKNNQPQCSIF